MGKPHSMDLRERVVSGVKSGMSCNRAAKQFLGWHQHRYYWMKRLREIGSIAPGKMGGHKQKKISGEHRQWLLDRIKDGDFTLRGLVAEFAKRGLKVDYHSVWDFVHAEKLSFKKKPRVVGERDRPNVARRRAQWTKHQGRVEPQRLVFVDETWTKTNMAPLRGWAPRGKRFVAKVPHLRGDDDLRGRAPPRPERVVAASGTDRWRELSNLRPESFGPDAAPR
jgi:transposase